MNEESNENSSPLWKGHQGILAPIRSILREIGSPTRIELEKSTVPVFHPGQNIPVVTDNVTDKVPDKVPEEVTEEVTDKEMQKEHETILLKNLEKQWIHNLMKDLVEECLTKYFMQPALKIASTREFRPSRQKSEEQQNLESFLNKINKASSSELNEDNKTKILTCVDKTIKMGFQIPKITQFVSEFRNEEIAKESNEAIIDKIVEHFNYKKTKRFTILDLKNNANETNSHDKSCLDTFKEEKEDNWNKRENIVLWYKGFKHHFLKIKQKKNPYIIQKCPICLFKINEIEKYQMHDCKHLFCKKCIIAFVSYKIIDKNVEQINERKIDNYEKIKCPFSNCKGNFTDERLKALLAEFNNDQKLKEAVLVAFPGFPAEPKKEMYSKYELQKKQIAYCKCGNYGIKENESDIVECIKCKNKVCFKCQNDHHPGYSSCYVFYTYILLQDVKYLYTTKCPRPDCGLAVTRTACTRQMKCSCGFEFCFECMKEWKEEDDCVLKEQMRWWPHATGLMRYWMSIEIILFAWFVAAGLANFILAGKFIIDKVNYFEWSQTWISCFGVFLIFAALFCVSNFIFVIGYIRSWKKLYLKAITYISYIRMGFAFVFGMIFLLGYLFLIAKGKAIWSLVEIDLILWAISIMALILNFCTLFYA